MNALFLKNMATCSAITQLLSPPGLIGSDLTQNPSVTYFRHHFRRHTPFAIENQLLQFTGKQHVCTETAVCQLQKSADMLYKVYAVIDLPGIANAGVVTSTGDVKSDIATHLANIAALNGVNQTARPYLDSAHTAIQAVPASGTIACEAVQFGDTRGNRLADYVEGGGLPLYGDCTAAIKNATIDMPRGTGADPLVPYWCRGVGFRLVKRAVLQIGGRAIDTVFSDFLFMYRELSRKPLQGVSTMVGGGGEDSVEALRTASKTFRRLHVPLPFFCTNATGVALPLVSLRHQGVAVAIDWNDVTSAIVNYTTGAEYYVGGTRDGSATTATLRTVVRPGEGSATDGARLAAAQKYGFRGTGAAWATWINEHCNGNTGLNVDTTASSQVIAGDDVTVQLECMFVFLDAAERATFQSNAFSMLMPECVPHRVDGTTDKDVAICLDSNHSVVELLFAVRQKRHAIARQWFNFAGVTDPVTGLPRDAIRNVRLALNGGDRFYTNNTGSYFRTVQPYQHHNAAPGAFVYSYSFALCPDDCENPSGQANFAHSEATTLTLTLDPYLTQDNTGVGGDDLAANSNDVIVYMRSWNVLRIDTGLASKTFATF